MVTLHRYAPVVVLDRLYTFARDEASEDDCEPVPCPLTFHGTVYVYKQIVCLPSKRTGRPVAKLFNMDKRPGCTLCYGSSAVVVELMSSTLVPPASDRRVSVQALVSWCLQELVVARP